MDTPAQSRKTRIGPFKMGWIIVMFDLPTNTHKERKAATDFRKFLLNDGYQMMQYSIYMRSCIDYERMAKHANRVESLAPSGGNIRILFITEKQWEKSINVIGKDYAVKHRLQSRRARAPLSSGDISPIYLYTCLSPKRGTAFQGAGLCRRAWKAVLLVKT